jgi:transposase
MHSDREGEAMKFVGELSQLQEAELVDALRGWDDVSEVRRVRTVRLSGKGWGVPRIAEALDCTRWSVRRWIDLYEAEGLEGLRTKPRSGRPPKVDDHYRQALKSTIRTPPRELGLAFNRWTLPRLGIYMDKKTGVTVSAGHMSRLLKELGYVYRRPRHDLSHRRDQKLYELKKKVHLRKSELTSGSKACLTFSTK